MPTYAYRCGSCNSTFDSILRIVDRDECPSCPDCKGPTVRVISAVSYLAGATARSTEMSSRQKQPKIAGQVGIHVDPGPDGKAELVNCTVANTNVGLALPEGANVEMSGSKFVNVKTPIQYYKK